MSTYDDLSELLDSLPAPGPTKQPSMRALESGRAQILSDEEREQTLRQEAAPENREAHQKAIETAPHPRARQALQEAYDQDTEVMSERGLVKAGPQRVSAETDVLDTYWPSTPRGGAQADESIVNTVRQGLEKAKTWVNELMLKSPLRPADKSEQARRIAERSRGNETQRAVQDRQRAESLQSAAEPGLRQEASRMRAANIEAEREGLQTPYSQGAIDTLRRSTLPVDALSAVERRYNDQQRAAKEKADADFWRNVGAYTQNVEPMYRTMLGGLIQGYGDALNAELDATEALDENLTGEISDRRRHAARAAEMGRIMVDQAEEIRKANQGTLKAGLGAQAVGTAIQSMALMGPALGMGMLTKAPAAVIAFMSGETGAIAYGEGRREGLSPGQAFTYATLQGLIEGATEYAPIKALFAANPGTWKWFSNFLAKEVPQEWLATGLQNAVDKVSVRPEMTMQDYMHDLLVTTLSTPISAVGQAGAMTALRGPGDQQAELRDQIMQKFEAGMRDFARVQQEVAKTVEQERKARGPATHTLEGIPVRPRVEGGKPVAGVWVTDEGDLVEAPRAEPIKKPVTNAVWKQGDVEYEVEITGKGREKDTVRLADGQEVPLNQISSLGDEALKRLGFDEKGLPKTEKLPVGQQGALRVKPKQEATPQLEIPAVTITRADAERQPGGEVPRSDVEPPPPPGPQRSGAAGLPPTPEEAKGEPGTSVRNGFKVGPEEGSLYRVGRSQGVYVVLEKRSPTGLASTFYVGKDGKLIDASNVMWNRPETVKPLWRPESDEIATEAKAILDEMGKLDLRDPARVALREKLAEIVKRPARQVSPEVVAKLRARARERATVDPENDSITDAIIKLGGIALDERLDISGDTKGNRQIPFVGYLFQKNGDSLDGMAEKLVELGYITEEERGDLNILAGRIKDELGGLKKHYSLNVSEARMAERLRGKQYEEDQEGYVPPAKQEEQLQDEADREAGDVPLWRDTTPEDMALEGLEAEARQIAIVDLMSQLGEAERERIAMQYADATDKDLLEALKKEIKRGQEAERGGRAGPVEGGEVRQEPPPEYRVTRGPGSAEDATGEAAEGEGEDRQRTLVLPDGRTIADTREAGKYFDALRDKITHGGMAKLVEAWGEAVGEERYLTPGARIGVRRKDGYKSKTEFLNWLGSDQAEADDHRVLSAAQQFLRTFKAPKEIAPGGEPEALRAGKRFPAIDMTRGEEEDEGAPVEKTWQDVKWKEMMDYYSATIAGRRALIMKPRVHASGHGYRAIVSGSAGQLENAGVAETLDEAKRIAFEGWDKDPIVRVELDQLQRPRRGKGLKGKGFGVEQQSARYETADQWVARIKAAYGDDWHRVAMAVIDDMERTHGERPVPNEQEVGGTLAAFKHRLTWKYLTDLRVAVHRAAMKVEQPKAEYDARVLPGDAARKKALEHREAIDKAYPQGYVGLTGKEREKLDALWRDQWELDAQVPRVQMPEPQQSDAPEVFGVRAALLSHSSWRDSEILQTMAREGASDEALLKQFSRVANNSGSSGRTDFPNDHGYNYFAGKFQVEHGKTVPDKQLAAILRQLLAAESDLFGGANAKRDEGAPLRAEGEGEGREREPVRRVPGEHGAELRDREKAQGRRPGVRAKGTEPQERVVAAELGKIKAGPDYKAHAAPLLRALLKAGFAPKVDAKFSETHVNIKVKVGDSLYSLNDTGGKWEGRLHWSLIGEGDTPKAQRVRAAVEKSEEYANFLDALETVEPDFADYRRPGHRVASDAELAAAAGSFDFINTFPMPDDEEMHRAGRQGMLDQKEDSSMSDQEWLKFQHDAWSKELRSYMRGERRAQMYLDDNLDPDTGKAPRNPEKFRERLQAYIDEMKAKQGGMLSDYANYFGRDVAEKFRQHIVQQLTGEPQKGQLGLFEKPTEPLQPKLTGPEPPLLTTPEGTAPPKSVDEQKVPTQQLKLFQLGGRYTVDTAAAQANGHEATEAQQEAGNYRKGHWIVGPKGWQLDVSIETAAGEKRRPEWPALKDHYGYIRNTVGFDKDHLDAFIKPGTTGAFAGRVYVVNQVLDSFDEHKVMIGYESLEDAREGYLRNYEKGWDGLDSIIPMSWEAFAEWARTEKGLGPKVGPLTMSVAKRFEGQVESKRALPTAPEGADRDQGGAAPQLDLFTAPAVQGTPQAPPAALFEKVVVESEKSGTIKLPKATVDTAYDAALAFWQISKSPRELFHLLALDADNKPIAYYPLFAGTVSQTSVYPREVWMAIYMTPGVKKVWMAHNHPSGLPRPSQADELLTDNIVAGLNRDFGVEFMGHIIIAGNTAYEMKAGEGIPFVMQDQAAIGVQVPIRHRAIKFEDWDRPSIQSPAAARDFISKQKIDRAGLILLDAQHRPVAFYYMTPQEMAKLRTGDLDTGFAKLVRQLGRNNPAAAMAYFPEPMTSDMERAVSNIGGAIELLDIRMLDAFAKAENGDLVSFAERGRNLGLRPFFSLSGRDPTTALTPAQVQAEIEADPIGKRLGNVAIVDNPHQLPEAMVAELHNVGGGFAKVRGGWDPITKRIYLVAGNIGKGEVGEIILHETVGHYGLQNILGKEYEAFMRKIYDARQADIQREARSGFLKQYDFDLRKASHQAEAAAEWLAHKAERGEEPTLWQKFVAFIRQLFTGRAFSEKWTDADILNLLKLSRDSLTDGGSVTFNGRQAWALQNANPIWRSTLMDAIREKAPTSAPAAVWRGFVQNLKGVKAEEIKWSGLGEWLDSATGTITKQDVLALLTDHGVVVEEHILGAVPSPGPGIDMLLRDRDDLVVALDAAGYDVEWGDNGELVGVVRRASDEFFFADPDRVVRPGERVHLFTAQQFSAIPVRTVRINGNPAPIRVAITRLREIAPRTAPYTHDVEQAVSAATRYETWILPGGRNYREILLTLPVQANVSRFTAPHFHGHIGQINLLGHVRVTERTDAEGKRVLFIEEFQSDWAERGRKPGHRFMTSTEKADLEQEERDLETSAMAAWPAAEEALARHMGLDTDKPADQQAVSRKFDEMIADVVAANAVITPINEKNPHDATAILNYVEWVWRGKAVLAQLTSQSIVPAAPFVMKTDSWVGLLLKRVIRYAVDNGFQRVAWTTGQQQVDRYSLEQHLSSLEVVNLGKMQPSGEFKYTFSGRTIRGAGWSPNIGIPDSQLDQWLPPEMIARVRENQARGMEPTRFQGEDLIVGGRGMKAFYDQVLPTIIGKQLAKLGGGSVGTLKIESGQWFEKTAQGARYSRTEIPEVAEGWRRTGSIVEAGYLEQPGFDVTPAMREQALRGLPMFSLRQDVDAMAEAIRRLGKRVDQAYRRGQKNAEDLDAELAALRQRYADTVTQLEGEIERDTDLEPGDEAFDYSTVEEAFRQAYWAYINGQPGADTKADLVERLRGSARQAKASDEQLIAAARDAYAAFVQRARRRGRPSFSLRREGNIRQVYGVSEGRLRAMAVRSFKSGVWDVYLATGTNENLFERGQYRREQASDLNEVQRVFNREGVELRIIKPTNTPVPDTSIFDQAWVAPKADTWLRRQIIYFQNRLLLPEKYEQAIAKQVGPIPEVAKAHREARLAHPRAAGKIADADHDYVDPIVDAMKRNRFTLKDVGRYLYARHAFERNAAIEAINPVNKDGSGMSDERANQVLADLERELGPERWRAMQQIGLMANRITHFREQLLIDKGLMTQEAVTLLREKYPNYVPLREIVEDEYAQAEIGGGFQVGRLINPAFGRFTEAEAEFILPGLVAQLKGTIAAGENAETLRALLRLVEYAPNPQVWRVQKHVWKPYIDKDTGEVRYAPKPVQIDQNYSGRAISVPVDGQRHIIVVADEDFARAFKSSGLPLNEFSQMIGGITRFYALMATAANPEFVMTNLMRDFQQAIIRISGEQNPKLALKVARDMPKALWGAYRGLRAQGQLPSGAGTWQRWYRRYIEAGGHIAYRGMADAETMHKDLMVKLADAGIYPDKPTPFLGSKTLGRARLRAHRGASLIGAKAASQLIIDVNGAVENALRLSAFKNAVEAGWNEKDAAMLARTVTVDFNLKGEAGTRIGAYYMFFNANLQGSALLFRSVWNHPAIRALAFMLFLMGAGFDWWNRRTSARGLDGRAVYDNINQYVRERNLVLMSPDGDKAITFPLPFGFNIFYVAGANMMAVIDGPMTITEAAISTLVSTINSINPMGQTPTTGYGAVQMISPTFLDPALQAMLNRNFMDKPIVPERPKTAPPQSQAETYFAGTPPIYVETARRLNEMTGGNEIRSGLIDISPNMLQHWTRTAFGSAGAFYSRSIEFGIARAVGEVAEFRDTPFLRRFVYEPKDFELSHRFYDNLNRAEVAHVEVMKAMELGKRDLAQALRENFQAERSMYLEAQATERQVAMLRKEMSNVRKNDRLADEQRKKQLEQLEGQVREAMMRFNKRFEDRTK